MVSEDFIELDFKSIFKLYMKNGYKRNLELGKTSLTCKMRLL